MIPLLAGHLVYPLLLAARGVSIRGPLRNLSANQWLSAAHLRMYQGARLADLIRRASSRHAWYQQYLFDHGVDPARISGLDDLPALPISEKQDIRRLGAELTACDRLPRGVTVRKTGGSTGAPCLVYADREASAAVLAARALCQGWHGLEPGDQQIRFWGRPLETGSRLSRIKDFALNRIRLDSLTLEPEQLPHTLRRIRRFGAKYCYGYASLIGMFAERLSTDDVAEILPQLKVVISTSETLTSQHQTELERKFGCSVVNEYGCSEVDIIAIECPAGGLHVVAGNLIVEVVRCGDEPAGYGQIIVTDLNNTLLPMVRYRVGDLAPQKLGTCKCGRGWPTLDSILGRSQGQYIITPRGAKVHSQFVVYMVEELVAKGFPIARFQIVQDLPDRLTLRLAAGEGAALDEEAILAYCRREGVHVLGDDMTWRLLQEPEAEFARHHVSKFHHFESELGDS